MKLYLHYQERIDGKLVVNKLVEFEDFCLFFTEEVIVEHYLNNMGKWPEVSDVGPLGKEKTLESQVVYIVTKFNLESYKKRHGLEVGKL